MAKHTFRNRLGELIEIPEVPATQAKNAFGELLGTKFDDLLAPMQTPAAREGMEAAFNANPAALGRAAAVAVRRRR